MNCSLGAGRTQLSLSLLTALLLTACTTQPLGSSAPFNNASMDIESLVLLGRRHLGGEEVAAELIDCVGKHLDSGTKINIVPEQRFLNELYPWFEPRTAPLRLHYMDTPTLATAINTKIQELDIRYIVWLESNAAIDVTAESISNCTEQQPACITHIHYQATVWDIRLMQEQGRFLLYAPDATQLPAENCKKISEEFGRQLTRVVTMPGL